MELVSHTSLRLSAFNDPAIRVYGAFIALTHAVCMLFWRSSDAVVFLGKGTEATCWPMLPGCEALRIFTTRELTWAFRGYFGAAILVALLFLVPRLLKLALAGLAGLTLFQIFIIALDFRLRANQNYMALWMTAVFLLVPNKRDTLRVMLVMFYVWAGSLKLNAEWLSGAALPRTDWIIPDALVVPACIYLVVLEMGISWGLLARRAWIFWAALAQVAVFHAVSWSQVGFFFPMTMFPLIAVFPLLRLLPATHEEPSLLGRIVRGRAPRPVYLVMVGFSLFQLPPLLIPGDAAVTGEGRSFALHMVDAGVRCRGWATVRKRDGSVEEVVLSGRSVVRMACDPILIRERARNICAGTSATTRDAVDLDLHLTSRRPSEPELRTIIDVPGYCARQVRYNPFGRNEWIQIR